MTELDASEDVARRRKDGTEEGWRGEGRQKESFSKTLLNTEIKEQRKAYVQGGKKINHKY